MNKPTEPTRTEFVRKSFTVSDESIKSIIDQLPQDYNLDEAIVSQEYNYGDATVVVEYKEEVTLTDKQFEKAQKKYQKDLEVYYDWEMKQQELKAAQDKIKKDPEYKELLRLQKKFKNL